MDLSIIIINWYSRDYLQECLSTLRANTSGLTYEIIVIDNASFDGCQETLSENFPDVSFIQSQQNLGFARANNRAAQQATGDALLFLNADTRVVQGALPVLLGALRKLPNAGAVGPKLLNSDLTLQTSCVLAFPTVANQVIDSEFLRHRLPHSRMWGIAALPEKDQAPTVVEGLSGASVMVKREVFECVRGFETRYFMYGEDVDLSFKIRQAGWKCYYVPGATVIHHGGGSSKKAPSTFAVVMMRQSIYRFMQLHRGRAYAFLFRVAIGASACVRLPLLVVNGLIRRERPLAQNGSIRKWIWILRWSLRLERWAESAGISDANPPI